MIAIKVTNYFQRDVFTKLVARAIIASTPNVARNRRSKPPTFFPETIF
jgi:hypothetical protein